MHTALVIVDVQNDFCTGGALAVPDADAVIPVVNALITGFRHVYVTQDWHPRGHVSFASSHAGYAPFQRISVDSGEQLLWPDHCVGETPGAALHTGLALPAHPQVVRKGTRPHVDSYSAFFENDGRTPVGLDALLRRDRVAALVVVGLATDFCVCHTALDARRLGYEVTVLESGCRGIDADGSLDRAWDRMTRAGVRRG
ncbi:MAG: bifunctional nicotinamidase/pyrazinamidase [Planctomycetia bacterium]|nr:bifunctional nicotinamidase/pyrazinamidase [Planctomycetia bacterium]